jgi:hypothetical protein
MRAGPLLLLICLPLLACGGEQAADPTAQPGPTALATGIEAGLKWLERAQEKDGSFSLHHWNPHHGHPGLPGFSEEDHWLDIAATGLVALTFAEAGRASLTADEDSCWGRALSWLLTKQSDEGRFGYGEGTVDHYFVTRIHKRGLYHPEGAGYKARTIHMFNHAVATAALATAYAASRDDDLRRPLKQALLYLVNDEHPEFMWTSYYDPFGDMGVVPYVLIAATAASAAGLKLESAPLLDPALDFLDRVTNEETGRAQMFSDQPHCFDGHDSTAINAYCRCLLGQDPGTGLLATALDSIAQVEIEWRGLEERKRPYAITEALGAVVNHELWFHGTSALRGRRTPSASRFRQRVLALLIKNQRSVGKRRGSWDPIGVWDRVGGRIYATAMATRTLASASRGRSSRAAPAAR